MKPSGLLTLQQQHSGLWGSTNNRSWYHRCQTVTCTSHVVPIRTKHWIKSHISQVVFFPPTCTSVARVSYVSLRQCQFCRPKVSATPGRLKAQCLAISVSTVWARVGSVMERYWSNSCCGMTFWKQEAWSELYRCMVRGGFYSPCLY